MAQKNLKHIYNNNFYIAMFFEKIKANNKTELASHWLFMYFDLTGYGDAIIDRLNVYAKTFFICLILLNVTQLQYHHCL